MLENPIPRKKRQREIFQSSSTKKRNGSLTPNNLLLASSVKRINPPNSLSVQHYTRAILNPSSLFPFNDFQPSTIHIAKENEGKRYSYYT